MPVAVAGELGPHCSHTCDVSSGGVMFCMDTAVEPGQAMRFTLSMPAADLCSPRDVLVNCAGRVARCSHGSGHYMVAVIIDEYQFERSKPVPARA